MEEVKQFRLRHRPDDTLKIRWAGQGEDTC